MKMTTESTAIKNYINLICSVKAKMKDDDAIRAVRTLRHLELRQVEIQTGVSAGAW
jgi:hypothetical protein